MFSCEPALLLAVFGDACSAQTGQVPRLQFAAHLEILDHCSDVRIEQKRSRLYPEDPRKGGSGRGEPLRIASRIYNLERSQRFEQRTMLPQKRCESLNGLRTFVHIREVSHRR